MVTLSSKVLRRFDRLNKDFVGKEFTEKYMKSKVELFMAKMEKEPLIGAINGVFTEAVLGIFEVPVYMCIVGLFSQVG